jgi:hypothetical protein
MTTIDTTITSYAGAVAIGKRTVFVTRSFADVKVGTQPDTSDLGEYKIGATTITGPGPLSTDEKRVIFREITGEVEL